MLFIAAILVTLTAQSYASRNATIATVADTSNSTSVNGTKPDTEPIIAAELIIPNPSHMRFELYTRESPAQYDLLVPGDRRLLSASHYRPEKNLYVLIHGFAESTSSEWVVVARKALLYTGDRNVLLIDWSPLTKVPRYDQSLFSVDFVGEYVGRMLRFLNPNPAQVHLVGFSLGAHVAAVTSNYFKPGRITGLDPAGPGFQNVPLERKLDREDAWFVDVIHTNAGDLLSGRFGSEEANGHVDFFPNGGRDQPGCGSIIPSLINSLTNLDFKKVRPCSHVRSTMYFIDSIFPETPKMTGFACSYQNLDRGRCRTNRTNTMGLTVDPSIQGVFVLKTAAKAPYSLNTYNIHVTIGRLFGIPTVGAGTLEFLFLLQDKTFSVRMEQEAGFRSGDTLTDSVSLPANVDLSHLTILASWNATTFSNNMFWLPISSINFATPEGQIRYCLGEHILLKTEETALLALSSTRCRS